LPAAGDDPAGIIEGACRVYSDCLDSSNLPQNLDNLPLAPLSDEQRKNAKACHQALFNVARVNPQIKGSKATQEWLVHHVSSGTEAKFFPGTSMMDHPR
jgi:hypothetical protein